MMHESMHVEPEGAEVNNSLIQFASKLVGATANYDGANFFTVKRGRR
jgi:hypothetical protein